MSIRFLLRNTIFFTCHQFATIDIYLTIVPSLILGAVLVLHLYSWVWVNKFLLKFTSLLVHRTILVRNSHDASMYKFSTRRLLCVVLNLSLSSSLLPKEVENEWFVSEFIRKFGVYSLHSIYGSCSPWTSNIIVSLLFFSLDFITHIHSFSLFARHYNYLLHHIKWFLTSSSKL